MGTGAKIFWSFLGGAVVGAAGIAWLNRGQMDFKYMKPIATEWLSKGMNLKDNVMNKVATMKEDFEDMSAEARDKADEAKLAARQCATASAEKKA